MTGLIETPITDPHVKALARVKCDLCGWKLRSGPYMLIFVHDVLGDLVSCYFHGVCAPKLPALKEARS